MEYARVCGESANHAMPVAKVLARKTEPLLPSLRMRHENKKRAEEELCVLPSSPSAVLGLSDAADKEEGLGLLPLASLCRFDRGGNFH